MRQHMERSETWRNVCGFWILGLCNNFAYVIMLSAAHDILAETYDPGPRNQFNNETNSTGRDCNSHSTGTVLLADVLPTIVMKLIAPFIHIAIGPRVAFVASTAAISFVLVAKASSRFMAFLGIVFASLSCGLGESSFLSYSSHFDKAVISYWSSGTGAAGLFGSLAYAGLTALGLSPRTTVLLMLVVPMVMALTFIFVISKPESSPQRETFVSYQRLLTEDVLEEEPEQDEEEANSHDHPQEDQSLTPSRKCQMIPSLLKYMIPLASVYVMEYLINQGLFELLYFPKSWLSHSEQYRWYQVDYQIGVFVSRSSVQFFHVQQIWSLSILQTINFVFLLFVAIYWFIPSIFIVLILIFWEGLLGGASYVNTFYKMSRKFPPGPEREFALGITSLADSLGVATAGALAIPLHSFVCGLPTPP